MIKIYATFLNEYIEKGWTLVSFDPDAPGTCFVELAPPAPADAPFMPADDYWGMRQLVEKEHPGGIDQDALRRMVACVTMDEPMLGPGSYLDMRNKLADQDAATRLRALRTPPPVPRRRVTPLTFLAFFFMGLFGAEAVIAAVHEDAPGFAIFIAAYAMWTCIALIRLRRR